MESLPSRNSIRSNTFSHSTPHPSHDHTSHDKTNPLIDVDAYHEPDLWSSAPLLFAVLPAVGGIAFKNGSILLTDLSLLVLAAIYLNWCIVTPWKWYGQARRIQLAKPPLSGPITEPALAEDLHEDGLTAEEVGGKGTDEGQDAPKAANGTIGDDGNAWPRRESVLSKTNLQSATSSPLKSSIPEEKAPHAGHFPTSAADNASQPFSAETLVDPTEAAQAELASHENLALAFTILGPLLGALLLHQVRVALISTSFHADELVSNMHLTLFVLGAELRPIRHAMTLVHNRTLHLQRIVREDPHALTSASTGSATEPALETKQHLSDLANRLDELERAAADSASIAQPSHKSSQNDPNSPATATQPALLKTQQTLQTQIDALNRAVRRYEKRATAQTLQTDSRLRELENRVQDSLTLAAVAARDVEIRRASGWVSWMLTWVAAVMALPLRVAKAALDIVRQAIEAGINLVGACVPVGLVRGAKRIDVVSSRDRRERMRVGVAGGPGSGGGRMSNYRSTGRERERNRERPGEKERLNSAWKTATAR